MNRAYRDYCRRRGAEMLRRQPPNFAPTLSAEELVVVYRAAKSTDLDILRGLMQSEGIMLELGKHVGKQTAHGIVYQICMETFEQHADFCEMLLKNETVAQHMTREEIQKILDPEGYTGLSGQICDRVVASIKAARNR